MKILSLFDGMSVAQQALKNAGIPIEKYYASEIDEYAIAVTQSNHPNTIQLGSVIGLKLDDDIDLLIGGSPCQDLSIAKKNREGLKGQRSGLFYEYVRIRDEVKPKYFILENVNSMPKEAKEQISEILGVQPVMINADLVSAQNRKRLFWVGALQWDGTYKQVEIPQPEDMGILLKDILESGESITCKSYALTSSCHDGLTQKGFEHYLRVRKDNFVYDDNEKMKTIRIRQIINPLKDKTKYGWHYEQGVYAIKIPEATKCGYALAHEGQAVDISFPNSKTRRGRVGDKVKNLMTKKSIAVVQNMQIRKLTPIECLRLQSMPDDYFDKAIYKRKPISNTQRYKMCGNAFNCKVIEHILRHIQ
jgi:DNA (cytosine-5)-methyltransferase 3A